MTTQFIPPHGGYEDLLSFQKARIVYDGTVWFCKHYLERRDRTNDQMVQAARSGKQNILEGSQASGTSKATEIKLTNVARASLEELLEDYRDFLRVRRLKLWSRDSRSNLCAKVRRPKGCVLFDLSDLYRNSPGRSRGQYSYLPDSPDQLPARSANSPTGEGISWGGRPARTHDPRAT